MFHKLHIDVKTNTTLRIPPRFTLWPGLAALQSDTLQYGSR